jgi:hypothetical protein
VPRKNPFDHQSIGSKNNRLAETRARSLNSATTHDPVTATVAPPPPPRRRLLEATSAKRKEYPITTGLLDYFPDACAAVAEVSFQGNQRHNPGEPLHWARGKSMDHADCCGRHLIERGGFDGGFRHTAALAWRAMALLQEELEEEMSLALPRGARVP